MAKVKVHDTLASETPEKVVTQAAEYTVTDDRGRKLTLKKPGILKRLNLIKIVGEHAANAMYWVNVAPVLYLAAIDGEAVAQPISQMQLDALLQRLDDEGITAIVQGVNQFWPAEDEEAHNEAVKK